MRKLLLTSTALVTAASISSYAMADVSVTGAFEWAYKSVSSSVATTDGDSFGSDNTLTISFSNKTDSGLTITFNADLDADSGGVDDNSMSISGGFGSITVGTTDGVEDQMAISADALFKSYTLASI